MNGVCRTDPSTTVRRAVAAAALALVALASRSPARAPVWLAAQEPCVGAPGAPRDLSVAVNGAAAIVSWKPPADGCAPTSYVIEAGSAPGLSDFPPTEARNGSAVSLNNIPEGLYFVRVRANNDGDLGAPSNEVRATIGNSPCGGLPPPPTGLFVDVSLTTMTVVWNRSTRSAIDYLVEIGTASGQTDVAARWTGSAEPTFTVAAGVGTYFVRVRPRNACGVGTQTNEVVAQTGGRPGVPDVIVARRSADRNTYFPTVERLRNGHLLVVFYDSPEHVSPQGRISLVKSLDGGRTWSAPSVVVDSSLDDRDPSVMQTRRGTLLLSYFSASVSGDGAGRTGVYVARSDDEGVTWSAPVKIETTLAGGATTAKIAELGNGDLLLPLYGATSRYARSAVVRSADDGLTWPAATEVVIRSSSLLDLVEPALVELDDTRLMMLMRTERSSFVAMVSHSPDAGLTWTEPVSTGIKALASDVLRLPAGPRRGSVVHTWGDWSSRYGDSRATLVQIIDASRATSLRYGTPHLVYNSHCDDASSPSSVVLGDGRLFTVFYDACAGYIGGRFVPVDRLSP